jgi:hypothetical protein
MITSRQIVDIIRKEKQKTDDEVMQSAYDNIINRIEVIEDVELHNRYSSFGQGRDVSERMSKVELEKVFK